MRRRSSQRAGVPQVRAGNWKTAVRRLSSRPVQGPAQASLRASRWRDRAADGTIRRLSDRRRRCNQHSHNLDQVSRSRGPMAPRCPRLTDVTDRTGGFQQNEEEYRSCKSSYGF